MHPAPPVLHRPAFAKEAPSDPDAVLADLEQVLDPRVAAPTTRRPGLGLANPEQGPTVAGRQAGRGMRLQPFPGAERLLQLLLDFLWRELARWLRWLLGQPAGSRERHPSKCFIQSLLKFLWRGGIGPAGSRSWLGPRRHIAEEFV